MDQNDRYSTEHFIIGDYHNNNCNIVSLHNSENNWYKVPVNPENYKFEIIKNEVLTRLNNFQINNYKEIVVLFFVSSYGESSELRFTTQINRIVSSGLYDASEKMLCFVCGNNRNIITKLASLDKIQIIQTKENKMEKFCFDSYKDYIVNIREYNFVYLHTKGGSHDITNSYINDWCELCNYFTIDMWKLNLILLEYYSCVGMNLMKYPQSHFSGNFWWATGEHLYNLEEPIGNKYLDPEMYLLNKLKIINNHDKIYQPNPLCLYKSIGNHAGANYCKNIYQKLKVSEILDRIPTNYIYNNHGDNIPINRDRITMR